MSDLALHSDEFANAAAEAGLRARRRALSTGHPVVFADAEGRFVQEWPDGRLFEVRFQSGAPRESHLFVVHELTHRAEVL